MIDDFGRGLSGGGGVGDIMTPATWPIWKWIGWGVPAGPPGENGEQPSGDSGLVGKLRSAWGKIQNILGRFRDIASGLAQAGAKLKELRQRAEAITNLEIRAAELQRINELQNRQGLLEREGAKIEARIEEVRAKTQAQEEQLREGLTGAALGEGMGFIFIPLMIVAGIVAASTGVVAAALAWMKSSEAHIKAVELEARVLEKIESGELTASEYAKIKKAQGAGFLVAAPNAIKYLLIAGGVIIAVRYGWPMVRRLAK